MTSFSTKSDKAQRIILAIRTQFNIEFLEELPQEKMMDYASALEKEIDNITRFWIPPPAILFGGRLSIIDEILHSESTEETDYYPVKVEFRSGGELHIDFKSKEDYEKQLLDQWPMERPLNWPKMIHFRDVSDELKSVPLDDIKFLS